MVDIDVMFKDVIFNVKPEEQKKLLKLYSNYKNIKGYENYEELESNIYAKQSVNNDKDKIRFELQRIDDFMRFKNIKNSDVYDRFYSIGKAFFIYDKYDDGNIDNSALKAVIESIILLETDLGMRIGLYKELCEYFEKEIQNKYNKNGYIKQEHRVKGNG